MSDDVLYEGVWSAGPREVGNDCEVATRDELAIQDDPEVSKTWAGEKFTPDGLDNCQRQHRAVDFVQMRVKRKQLFKIRLIKLSDLHSFPSRTPSKRIKSCPERQL